MILDRQAHTDRIQAVGNAGRTAGARYRQHMVAQAK